MLSPHVSLVYAAAGYFLKKEEKKAEEENDILTFVIVRLFSLIAALLIEFID